MAKPAPIINRIAPWRFLMFFALLAVGAAILFPLEGWRGLILAFDAAGLMFLLTMIPLYGCDAKQLRAAAKDNDANRTTLLVLTFVLTIVILATVTSELGTDLASIDKLVIIGTLVTVWTFGNMVYTLHYAHLFYTADDGGKDCAGLIFPATRQPLLSDFTYFAFTLGVAVQTSDVEVTSTHIRKVVTAHCVAGFFFNLGVLALTINVLGQN